MSPPPPGLDNPYDEFKDEIRKQMKLILKYYDGINTRSLSIQKEIQTFLTYLLDLKKSKPLTSTSDADDLKVYETMHKM